jgi:hypothetical protein
MALSIEQRAILTVADQIAKLEEVILIVTSGAYDVIAEVICALDLSLQFLQKTPIDGVRRRIPIHLKIVKYVYF